MLLDARDLEKRFRRFPAVAGVSLSVRAGERVALLGPNGAGKTTTLLMLVGAIAPDAGQVRIAGNDVHRQRVRALRHVGFAAGNLLFTGRLRVIEYLRFFARIHDVAEPDTASRVALERLGVGHLANKQGRELSSGQRTIVGIARAIVHRPSLLVLDEPTAFLDPDVSARVRSGLLDLVSEHQTALVLTSHNMIDVERVCERVVFMRHGEVVADDTPEHVAGAFGHDDLEGVFRQIAAEQEEVIV